MPPDLHATLGALGRRAKRALPREVRAVLGALRRRLAPPPAPPPAPDEIDVRDLLRRYTVEELAEAAEAQMAQVKSRDYHLSRPFGGFDETPEILIRLGTLIKGLDLLPDHRVLEFGAGSCWATRILTQMGCKTYALDVSRTALDMGAELLTRLPIVGDRHTPELLHFDGRRIPLDDGSVDRVFCFDAFHHVPNPTEVLGEMARVLAPGGVAGFAEPGPSHSRNPQSQFEMKNFRVIENDIVIEEIWRAARAAGFSDLRLAVFDAGDLRLPLDEFNAVLAGRGRPSRKVARHVRDFLVGHRMFFLSKGAPAARDSRRRLGLRGDISVTLPARWAEGNGLHGAARVVNTSDAIWLPTTARVGAVHFGAHLLDAEGRMVENDFFRANLTESEGRPLRPGEQVEITFVLPAVPPGRWIVEFDLVAEQVCWFAMNGSPTVRCPVEGATG